MKQETFKPGDLCKYKRYSIDGTYEIYHVILLETNSKFGWAVVLYNEKRQGVLNENLETL